MDSPMTKRRKITAWCMLAVAVSLATAAAYMASGVPFALVVVAVPLALAGVVVADGA